MNLVGSGFWKTFNFKSMKNSKSSSVKPTTSEDTTTASIKPLIKRESKKGSKVNHKQSSEQSKSPLVKTFKSNNKHGSFGESAKGGEGGGEVDLLESGNNQIGGSNNVNNLPPPSSTIKSTNDSTTMVTNLKRAASFPLTTNTYRPFNNNLNHTTTINHVKQLGDSVPITPVTVDQQLTNCSNSESMFQFFDTNGNGYISEDELIQMMDYLGEPITTIEAKLMIKEADTNHDGKIDYIEFRNLINNLPLIFNSLTSLSLNEAFKIFDKDSDGYVNLEEVKLIATAIGIVINEKNIDTINNLLQQSTASSSSSSSNNQQPNINVMDSEKLNLDQLTKFFATID